MDNDWFLGNFRQNNLQLQKKKERRLVQSFINLVIARMNLPLPEPERSEAKAYFDFVDFQELEFYELFNRMKRSSSSLSISERAKMHELAERRDLYRKDGRFEYYFETEQDGHNDPAIEMCTRYLFWAKDEDILNLNEKQHAIAMDLVELNLLNSDIIELRDKFQQGHTLTRAESDKVLKWRYLRMKYGRQERLAAQRRRITAACLGPGFTIDW